MFLAPVSLNISSARKIYERGPDSLVTFVELCKTHHFPSPLSNIWTQPRVSGNFLQASPKLAPVVCYSWFLSYPPFPGCDLFPAPARGQWEGGWIFMGTSIKWLLRLIKSPPEWRWE